MAGWPNGDARPTPSAYNRIPPLRWLARQVGLLDVLGEPDQSINKNKSYPPGYQDTGIADRLERIGGETWKGLSEHFSDDYGPSGESLRLFVNSASPFLNYVNRTLLKGGGSLLDLAGRTVTAPFTVVGAGGGQIIRDIEDNPRSASANAFRRDLNLLSHIAPQVAGSGGVPRVTRSVGPIPQRPVGSTLRADAGGLLHAFDEPPPLPPLPHAQRPPARIELADDIPRATDPHSAARSTSDRLSAEVESPTNVAIATAASARPRSNTTRFGVPRNSRADWHMFREQWDKAGYGEILSPANRARIDRGISPVVDETWVRYFTEDAGLIGEKIHIHHIDGSALRLPWPRTRHRDAHLPGGTSQNFGGPGSAAPFYVRNPLDKK